VEPKQVKADKYLITKLAYDAVAEGYAENAFAKQWMRGYVEDFCTWVGTPAKVLDLGCGPGHDVALLVARGFEVVGIDVSEKMVKEARKRVPTATFVQGDFRTMDFESETFDAVWSVGSLHHVAKTDLQAVLVKVYQYLKSGGAMFVSMASGEGEKLIAREQIGVGKIVEKFWSYWQPEGFARELARAGFWVVKQTHTETMRKQELPEGMKNGWWINVWCRK
jgi:ubiquinone/menaquinone biosynthesis C-methylase UbiE